MVAWSMVDLSQSGTRGEIISCPHRQTLDHLDCQSPPPLDCACCAYSPALLPADSDIKLLFSRSPNRSVAPPVPCQPASSTTCQSSSLDLLPSPTVPQCLPADFSQACSALPAKKHISANQQSRGMEQSGILWESCRPWGDAGSGRVARPLCQSPRAMLRILLRDHLIMVEAEIPMKRHRRDKTLDARPSF